ncbi:MULTISPECIES: BON domain-containing protein [Thalassospira]|uniref:BON domain-containing protein n=2 Tax=Thalassospira tepidiphila TaxID=393657 RepID=A0A853KYT9_9PROT|nr:MULTISPECIES: BON domain-containing protein [Thalassospira]MBO6581044.1 BON domain-containing protein [Thalassospira sp.]MBO6804360.1 BON domain-containing protein [Thalassospira sp.]MBO6819187.1 BON domain-containing protein [Thalassospira sp.]MBO6888516.1 BON domain-containing protein [Thalassospira sp.]MBP3127509.1 BON domain-containing protein [Thalassospira sp. ER-Se-21-Dark]|tara:strand:+ start:444 stop:1073 length:630 start_codon:yes stop_codon:yes gene_type:complete
MIKVNRGIGRVLKTVSVCALLAVPLAACGPLQMPLEDRTGNDQWQDTQIKSGILGEFSKVDHTYLMDVNIDIWEQNVMVTGMVDSKGKYYDVMSLVKQDNRIKTVYDHLVIADQETIDAYHRAEDEYGKNAVPTDSATQSVSDVWIESQIKALLLAEKGVSSVNYRWQSVQNVVYIMGEAQSDAELEKVLSIVRRIKGVTKVVSHIAKA